jgi:Uma2 family endonuclease
MVTDISALDLNKQYSYADYLTWQLKERIELIKGRIFKMTPAPARKHQKISGKLFTSFSNYFFQHDCDVYSAPFDVRFPSGKDDSQTYTVVQPDISVICDKSKLDDRGCVGAPDLIVEILSPATSKKDAKDKFQLYEETGVKEYWMVDPDTKLLDIFILEDDNKYHFAGKYTEDDVVKVNIFPELEIDLKEVFKDDVKK